MIVEKLEAIKKALEGLGSETTGHTVIDSIGGILDITVPDSLLYDLIESKIITAVKRNRDIGDYIFSINKGTLSNLPLLEKALQNYLYASSGMTDLLVCSYPKGLGISKISDVSQLYPALCSLISETNSEILVVNPFFDQGGTDKIAPYIKAAIERGVKLKIITGRAVDGDNDSKDTPFSYFVSSLGKPTHTSLQIRRFYGREQDLSYSTHAKFMVFDKKKAYLGSANLTQRSLSANLELGIVTTGPKVAKLVEIFDCIWDVSKILTSGK